MKGLKFISSLSLLTALGTSQAYLNQPEEGVWLISSLIALATGVAAAITASLRRTSASERRHHTLVTPRDIQTRAQTLKEHTSKPTPNPPKPWQAPDDHTQQLWESILERRQGAPKVGHAMRAVFEEALARQDPRVGITWSGASPASSEIRLLVNRLQCTLTRRMAELGLVLITDNPDETLHAHFEFELINQSTLELVQARSAHHSRRLGPQLPRYPVASIRARLRCGLRVEAVAEADSSANIKAARQQGEEIDVDTIQRLACRATLASLFWGMGITAEPRTHQAEARIAS